MLKLYYQFEMEQLFSNQNFSKFLCGQFRDTRNNVVTSWLSDDLFLTCKGQQWDPLHFGRTSPAYLQRISSKPKQSPAYFVNFCHEFMR